MGTGSVYLAHKLASAGNEPEGFASELAEQVYDNRSGFESW